VPVFVGLIKSNIIHLIGMVVYGVLLIGLTAVGYKVLASLVGFEANKASDKEYRFMGILTLGLIIGFSLIIALGSYKSAPKVVIAPGDKLVQRGGGCGSKSRGAPCGSTAPRIQAESQ
jgi:hypothetical protein